jgi:hypothetical protein
VGPDPGTPDDLVVIPSDGIGKERSDVNSLSYLYVAAHQSEMLNLAANERLARPLATQGSNRLGAALKSVWSLLNGSASRPLDLPKLTDYPYRG